MAITTITGTAGTLHTTVATLVVSTTRAIIGIADTRTATTAFMGGSEETGIMSSMDLPAEGTGHINFMADDHEGCALIMQP